MRPGLGMFLQSPTVKFCSLFLCTIAFFACKGSASISSETTARGTSVAVWARSTTSAAGASNFQAIARDSSGNLYVVGYQTGNATFSYGGSASAAGAYNGMNAVIVKYDANGNPVWARSTTTASNKSSFNAIAIDSSDNVYAVGSQYGSTVVNYSASISATGANASSDNAVIVKYDNNGNATWARVATVAPSQSFFQGVGTDAAGNVFAVGYQTGTSAYTYAAGVSVAGTTNLGGNALLVKYDTNGTALFARSTTSGSKQSIYNSVALDSGGNVYAVGTQTGNTTYNYSASVTATGAYTGGGLESNVVLVKYDNSGTALWARSTLSGSTYSSFSTVAVDSGGNAYCTGFQTTNATFTYSGSVSATAATAGDTNALLVKYDSAGTALWARTTTSATYATSFSGVAFSSNGQVFAIANSGHSGSIGFGNGQTVTSTVSAFPAIIKYDSGGTPQQAFTIASASSYTALSRALLDASGNLYVVGYQDGSGAVDYGGASVAGAYAGGMNAAIVKFSP